MIKKQYKYKKNLVNIKKIMEKWNEETFMVLIQVNGLSGKKLIKLNQYAQYNSLDFFFFNNILKKRLIELKLFNEHILNNEIIGIKGHKVGDQLKGLIKYINEQNLNENLIILNFVINYDKKLKVQPVQYYNTYLKNQNTNLVKSELYKDVFKTVKIKLLTLLLKLKYILDGNIQSNKR
uniref:Mp21-like protein n=1 Tax=Cavenderia fasciculata TaxID=261658 RepID=B2XX90_CACFS|nr:Mp21-like protein [Cavenderia fasciculata]ABX45212.1 Mp21-like protein [Cavenderia fasciculata]